MQQRAANLPLDAHFALVLPYAISCARMSIRLCVRIRIDDAVLTVIYSARLNMVREQGRLDIRHRNDAVRPPCTRLLAHKLKRCLLIGCKAGEKVGGKVGGKAGKVGKRWVGKGGGKDERKIKVKVGGKLGEQSGDEVT